MPATPEIMITCGCTAAPITPATSPKFAVSEPAGLVKVEVPFDLLALLAQQHRQQIACPEPAAEPRPQPRVQRWLRAIDCMAMFGEQLAPHLDVPLLDPGQLDVDVFLVGIRLLSGERQIEKRGVSFILPMVEPFLHIRCGHAASYYAARP